MIKIKKLKEKQKCEICDNNLDLEYEEKYKYLVDDMCYCSIWKILRDKDKKIKQLKRIIKIQNKGWNEI